MASMATVNHRSFEAMQHPLRPLPFVPYTVREQMRAKTTEPCHAPLFRRTEVHTWEHIAHAKMPYVHQPFHNMVQLHAALPPRVTGTLPPLHSVWQLVHME